MSPILTKSTKAEKKIVSNNEVIFENNGNPIVLAKNKDFASLGTATRKCKFKNKFYQEVPIKIDENT